MVILADFSILRQKLPPNKSLEPTAESAGSSAARATLFGRLWLSFGR
jgi:hypothetical protein